MTHIDWHPSPSKLRTFFGLLILFALLLCGWFAWRGHLTAPVIAVASILGAIGLLGVAAPQAMRPFYVVWMVAVFPIGWCLSLVVLAVVYYGCFTPLGWWLRRRGRDPLQLRRYDGIDSYWKPHPPADDRSGYFRQF